MNNLKPWPPGISGNPKGRPKGTRNIKRLIQELLNDPYTYQKLAVTAPGGAETPLEAIVYTLMIKSMEGDVRASDVLLKHAIDKEVATQDNGFFNQTDLKITVIGADGNLHSDSQLDIDDAKGTLNMKS